MQPVSASTTLAFLLILVAVAIAHVVFAYSSALRRGATEAEAKRRGWLVAFGVLVLLAITGAIAASGALLVFDTTPPRFPPFMGTLLLGTFALAFSRYGRELATTLPMAWLVGLHAFRFPLELVLHRLHLEGAIPVQMTFEGRNFDILTGLTALGLAALIARGRAPRGLVLAWNVGGLALVVNISAVALLSVPGPLRVFMNAPANTLPAVFPFVWLPALLVTTALFGHVLVFRKLAHEARVSAAAPGEGAELSARSRSY